MTRTELPIACSLNAADLQQRLREISALGRDALIDSTTDASRAVLRFEPDQDTRARIERIVAAEQECCAFLTMTIDAQPDVTLLTIEAPDGAEPVMHDLVSAFAS